MFRRLFCALAASVLLLAPAAAQQEGDASLHFLGAGQVELTKILPPPPKPGSKAQQRDMAISLAWQARRTPAMAALAQADADRSVFRFGVIFGDSFTRDRLPLAARFFEDVAQDERIVGAAAKTYWNRPRPFVASALIHPCLEQPPTNSYPSNHAAIGMLYAQILARMMPERRLGILARAQQYSEDRVICGVHYASDIEAGKRAGAIEAFAMFHNAAFRREFDAAKAEILSALPPPRRAGAKRVISGRAARRSPH
jgi:acid phosphatase (class A)